jgi:hypothetical protein
MYLNNFRARFANGLETCKKVDILEKKAALDRSPGVDEHAVKKQYTGNNTLAAGKKIRGATQTKTEIL